MRHLIKKHPLHLDACVQFSIAMAYDMEPEEVAHDLHTWGALSTSQVRKYLVRKGLSATGDSVEDAAVIAEGKGIVIAHGVTDAHAVAFKDGIIFDPNGPTFASIDELCAYYAKHTGESWELYAIFENKAIKYRDWAINQGNQNEEVAL